MAGLTAKKILSCERAVERISVFGGNCGEAIVLASPFVLALVIVAQTYPLSLLCSVEKGQTDGQWRVQLGDSVTLAVQKSDVQDRTDQYLWAEGAIDTAVSVSSDKTSVGLVAQAQRDQEGP